MKEDCRRAKKSDSVTRLAESRMNADRALSKVTRLPKPLTNGDGFHADHGRSMLEPTGRGRKTHLQATALGFPNVGRIQTMLAVRRNLRLVDINMC